MASTSLSKIILLLSVVAFVLYVVGFASPNWLEKNFVLKNIPQNISGMILPTNIEVKSHMGLLKSCEDKTVKIPALNATKVLPSDCGSDGAKDWQKIAGGLSIAALVFAFISLTLSTLAVFVTKLQNNKYLLTSVVVINFITVGFMLGSISLYIEFKRIQVSPPIPTKIDYDISWAFFVFVASCALYAFLVLLNVFGIVGNPGKTGMDLPKEPSVSYANY